MKNLNDLASLSAAAKAAVESANVVDNEFTFIPFRESIEKVDSILTDDEAVSAFSASLRNTDVPWDAVENLTPTFAKAFIVIAEDSKQMCEDVIREWYNVYMYERLVECVDEAIRTYREQTYHIKDIEL